MRLKPIQLAAVIGLLVVVAAASALVIGINRVESGAKRDAAVASAWAGGVIGALVAFYSYAFVGGYLTWKFERGRVLGPNDIRGCLRGCLHFIGFWIYLSLGLVPVFLLGGSVGALVGLVFFWVAGQGA
jgi:hypothetical protein